MLTADGTNAAGNSKIELILGTADPENRTTAGNIYQGESLNIYQPIWEQLWNDKAGGMIHFYSGVSDRVMRFYAYENPAERWH